MSRGPEAFTCRFCGHKERREEHVVLHIGRAHAGVLDGQEAAAFAAAKKEEEAILHRVSLHVGAALLVLPIVLFYLFLIGALLQAGANIGFALMGAPGIVAFCVFGYFLMLSRDRLSTRPDLIDTPDQDRDT
ncbi:MAG: hypothetical protein KY455_03400 [Euryarchaeota archaeon]|nr:hypothetical protein [Euryarchaeota archaeon]